MNTARRAAFAVCLTLLLGCAPASVAAPVDVAAEKFVATVARDWSTYQVTDHRERNNDRKAFYTRVLALQSGALQRVSAWRELTVRQSSAEPSVHLGVAELEFATAAQARSFAQPDGTTPRYLAELKILTRYVTVLRDRSVLVLYSENHQRPEVASFLQAAPQMGGELWGK